MKMRPDCTLPTPAAQARFVWWLHPSLICFLGLIPLYLLLWLAGVSSEGQVSTARGYFYFEGEIAWLGLAGLVALGLGTLSPVRPALSFKNQSNWVWVLPAGVLTALGVLALIGYAYWFKDLILHPGKVLDALSQAGSLSYAFRANVEKSAGLASLAQLGLPFVVLYAHQFWATDRRSLTSAHRVLLLLICLAIAFRAIAWAERLALIEMTAGVVMIWASYRTFQRPAASRLLALLPLFACVFGVLFFALGEYFRSWSSFYAGRGLPFWDFIGQRIANYYFAALNTGAGRLAELEWPTYSFVWTLRWLHKLPIVGGVFSYYTEARPDFFLARFGDPEFNNPSGLFSIYLDVGIVAGLSLFVALGAAAKYCYGYLRFSRSLAGVSYFVFLMCFLEMFRYFYLGDSRAFMVVLGLALGLLACRRERLRDD